MSSARCCGSRPGVVGGEPVGGWGQPSAAVSEALRCCRWGRQAPVQDGRRGRGRRRAVCGR